jgi:phosphoglycolate phosphatase
VDQASGNRLYSVRAVIFDFDGTLTPLTLDFSFLRARVEEIAREYVGQDVIDRYKDQYILEMIHAIEDEIEHSTASFRARAFRELDRLEVEACRDKELYPYARQVLSRLRERSICAGIITRSSATVIRTIFSDLDQYIDVVVTRDDTRYVKPDPRQLHMAVEALHVPAEDAIIVGDHPTDIAAGRALGAMTAGVLSGRCTRDDFIAARADHILGDIRGIIDLLNTTT